MSKVFKYIFLSSVVLVVALLMMSVFRNGRPWDDVSSNLCQMRSGYNGDSNGVTWTTTYDGIELVSGTASSTVYLGYIAFPSDVPDSSFANALQVHDYILSNKGSYLNFSFVSSSFVFFQTMFVYSDRNEFTEELSYVIPRDIIDIKIYVYVRSGETVSNGFCRDVMVTISDLPETPEYTPYTGKFEPSYKNGIVSSVLSSVSRFGAVAEKYVPDIIADFKSFSDEFNSLSFANGNVFETIWNAITFATRVMFYPLTFVVRFLSALFAIAVEAFTFITTF